MLIPRHSAWLLVLTLPALLGMACGATPRKDTMDNTQNAAREPHAAARDSTAVTPLTVNHEHWQSLVSPEAWHVLFEEGTERAFTSPLNDENREGTFVCAACNLPVFSSTDKFNSGTGWPSFTAPLPGKLGFTHDTTMIYPRVEYHCVRCGGHMGHVFDDGPPPTRQRWCNNGVSIRFIPRDEPLPELRD